MAVGSNGDIAWGFTNSQGDWSDRRDRRAGAGRSHEVPDARWPAGLRRPQRVDRREGRRAGDDRGALDDLGPGRRHRPRPPGTGAEVGGARSAGAGHRRGAHRPGARASTRRCGCRWARRWPPRTWSSAIATAISAGPSTAPSRVAWAAPATPRGAWGACPRRGPTDRIAGTATWATTSTRASSIRPTAGCGRPTPAWSAARCCGKIGDGGYSDGIRAWMIRDDLQRLDTADERALFDVQLDNRFALPRSLARRVPRRAHRRSRRRQSPLRTAARQLVESVVDRAARRPTRWPIASCGPSG